MDWLRIAQMGPGGLSMTAIAAILVVVVFLAVLLAFVGSCFNLYLMCLITGTRIGLLHLMGMRLRKVDLKTIIYSRIRSVKAGLSISARELESHYLAGGRVPEVVSALIAARTAGIDLDFETACAADLQGFDPLAGVHAIVHADEPGVEGFDPYSAHALVLLMRERGRSTAGLRLPPLPEPRPE